MSAPRFDNNYCKNRVKPSLLKDIKTEAILVFSRTALERFFSELQASDIEIQSSKDEETHYVYSTLKTLLVHLQDCVVNADYLIDLAKSSKNNPLLQVVAKKEDSLMSYYDLMAKKVRSYYHEKPLRLPELLVICVLSEWLLGEEKSTHLYPFLNDIDFLDLLSKFEINRKLFQKDDVCAISEIHEVSFKIIEKLKSFTYKLNTHRVSKTRKKSKRSK